jgi:hypothetical protein
MVDEKLKESHGGINSFVSGRGEIACFCWKVPTFARSRPSAKGITKGTQVRKARPAEFSSLTSGELQRLGKEFNDL